MKYEKRFVFISIDCDVTQKNILTLRLGDRIQWKMIKESELHRLSFSQFLKLWISSSGTRWSFRDHRLLPSWNHERKFSISWSRSAYPSCWTLRDLQRNSLHFSEKDSYKEDLILYVVLRRLRLLLILLDTETKACTCNKTNLLHPRGSWAFARSSDPTPRSCSSVRRTRRLACRAK